MGLNRLALKKWEENWAKSSVIVAEDLLVSYWLIFLQKFTKLNNTSINYYNLRNLETDLALSRPKTNFLN